MYIIKLNSRKSAPGHQQGFVLVMALVLLAVMTLIGVASMNSANIELKATANARQHQLAFNNVQSLLEYTLATDALRDDGEKINYQTTAAAIQSVIGGYSTASIAYAGCASRVGNSLEEGKGFSFNFYSVAATGTNATNTSTVLLNQGARYPSAACESL